MVYLPYSYNYPTSSPLFLGGPTKECALNRDLQEVVEHFISKQQFQSWPYSLHGWSSPLSKQEELLGRMRMIYKTTFRWSSLSITTWRSWYHSSWESRFSAMPMALRSSHSHPATLKLLTRQIFNENSLQWSQMLLVL